MSDDITVETQQLFLELMLTEPELYTRVQNIYDPNNFAKPLKKAAFFINEFAQEYSELPDFEIVNSALGTKLTKPDIKDPSKYEDWFLEEFEKFTKKESLSRAILKAAEMIERGEFNPVENLVKEAVQISLTRDLGTDYFADPKQRLENLKNNNGQASTGWPSLDSALYGGFNKGELEIFAGGSGSGKSLFMQNLAVNWMERGLNGIYLTLELSEGLVSMRLDSMITGISTKNIFKDLGKVEQTLAVKRRKLGKLWVKYLPAQSTVNDIRAYIRELKIKTGIKVDFMMIDYLDLIMPVTAKVSPTDVFIKDKYVSEELRNLAGELQILFVTASQLNRSSVEEVDFDHSMIAGGLSKINTADNVIGIYTNRSMREQGRYQLQLMKTRSSAGVGKKIDLEFDIETLRITDAQDVQTYSNPEQNAKDLAKKIRAGQINNTNTNSSGPPPPSSSGPTDMADIDMETGEILQPNKSGPKLNDATKLMKLLKTMKKQ